MRSTRVRQGGRGSTRGNRPLKGCVDEGGGCEIAELFHILGKTYVLGILHIFTQEEPGPKRFVDLQKRLSMSPNTLSDRLKELVRAGLLTRTAYNEIPPRVDYDATAKAFDLKPVFESLSEWSQRHNLKPEPVEAGVALAVAA